ncbi:hypothetical protein L861_04395 [Litchfieldella anticariensis FP35 = DSM 16096]|uniref:Uncharacterized protein n=1 Tax=Litchfieldella anticariensis (strain DSM 16096 / CECT 5854 / CIP 108499 / LMG 22089 / FP35) TaxID=1121939 RepID=S2L9L7_LITA3|nr:hypothetical protein L861_04395 [Halomonas anticariensis FP35 = DSM 16096]
MMDLIGGMFVDCHHWMSLGQASDYRNAGISSIVVKILH